MSPSRSDVDAASVRMLLTAVLVHAQASQRNCLSVEADRQATVDNALKTADLIIAKVDRGQP